MFNSKYIVTTAVILSGLLMQQSAVAYPRASKRAEMDYLKSVLSIYFGQPMPNLNSHVEREYRNKSDDLKTVLISGYTICDDIDLANQEGISGEELLSEEIANFGSETYLSSGRSFTKEDLIAFYDSTTRYLCPELY